MNAYFFPAYRFGVNTYKSRRHAMVDIRLWRFNVAIPPAP
jgi:hypothetical protein